MIGNLLRSAACALIMFTYGLSDYHIHGHDKDQGFLLGLITLVGTLFCWVMAYVYFWRAVKCAIQSFVRMIKDA